MNDILDASAMIALLRGESGEDVVWEHLSATNTTCFAHAINLCEVFYEFWRLGGADAATGAINDLRALGILERNDFDPSFWQEVGRLKAVHRRVSLADCCALTLTNRIGGMLLTSDHHELDSIAALGVCPITFIR